MEDAVCIAHASSKGSTIRELLKLTAQPEIISFSGGLPAPEVFPVERFEAACHKVLEEHGALALQYGATEGYEPLREQIAKNMGRYGILAKAENVLITTGSQQALDLIGKLLINSGDRVLVEAPSYLGALQAFNLYGAQFIPVPVDDDGLRTDQLESALSVEAEVHVHPAELPESHGSHAFRRAAAGADYAGR